MRGDEVGPPPHALARSRAHALIEVDSCYFNRPGRATPRVPRLAATKVVIVFKATRRSGRGVVGLLCLTAIIKTQSGPVERSRYLNDYLPSVPRIVFKEEGSSIRKED